MREGGGLLGDGLARGGAEKRDYVSIPSRDLHEFLRAWKKKKEDKKQIISLERFFKA